MRLPETRNYLVCETHLETIEDAVRYIYEQSMTLSNPEEIGFQLDNLISEVDETSQIINDLDQDIMPDYINEWDTEINLDSILDELSDEVNSEINPKKRIRK